MTDISRLCMACLSEKDKNGICPKCKKDVQIIQKAPFLPLRTIIAGRYCIAKAIKHNGEGVTYLAFDLKYEKAVSIREFFPENLVARDADKISVSPVPGSKNKFGECLDSFYALWRKLLRLKGLTALISVTDVTTANGTVYAVYAESELITLRDYLLQTKEGFISWEKARILFMPVLSTLGTLHTSGIIHRGINPSAFVFSKEGRLKLTDFCTETSRILLGDIEAEIFDGYTPFEQYGPAGHTGPWSDIYSFCSVLYRALIGATPIDAKTRALNDRMMIPAKFAENLPPYVINALINGMQIKSADRTSNIEQLRSDLSASPRAVGASAPAYTPAPREKTPPDSPPPAKSVSGPAQSPSPIRYEAQQTAKKKAAQKSEAHDKVKREKNKIIILSVILAIFIFGIGFFTRSLIDIKRPLDEKNQTTDVSIKSVPDFKGKILYDVLDNPEYVGFFQIISEYKDDPDSANGIIIDQSIPAGATATKGDRITLFVSRGPKQIILPNIIGEEYEQGEAKLKAMGLLCKKSSKLDESGNTVGVIAETIPPAGQKVREGDTVIIVVYINAEEDTSVQALPNDNSGNSVEEFFNEQQMIGETD